jgi:endonuclease YncB( thermonuclease family)
VRPPLPIVQRIVTLAFVTLLLVLIPHPALAATPQPNPTYFGALPWELPDDAEAMVVHSITDGDTIRLTYPNNDWYYNTRLIGIQAPEMDGPWTSQECYGPEAKNYLIDLLPVGTTVYVQQDIDDEDRNGRRLRHIFIIDPDNKEAYLLSEVLVLGGFAKARSYPPNDLYDDILAEAQQKAEKANDGLWNACAA